MFSKPKLFSVILLALAILHSSVVLTMSKEQTEFIESLEKLKSGDVEKNIITQEVIFDIKKKWYALVIWYNDLIKTANAKRPNEEPYKEMEHLESEEFSKISKEINAYSLNKFKNKVFFVLHSDKWPENVLEKNKQIAVDLRNIIMNGKHTDNTEIKSERSLFQILIKLEELYTLDLNGIIIDQSKFQKLEQLWNEINYQQLNGTELVFAHIEPLCDINKWKSQSNKASITALGKVLSVAITSFNPKKRIFRCLEQLKQADNNLASIKSYEIAMIKKLWYQVGSYSNISCLAETDIDFQKNVRDICDKDKWQDCNKNKIDDLKAFFNDKDALQKLGLLHQAQNEFLAQLKALKEMDSLNNSDASKKITDENIQKIADGWKNINQLTIQCDRVMDMDFYNAVRSQLFLQTWQPANQAKITAILNSNYFNELRADLSSDDQTQSPLSFWETVKLKTRSIIDPYYRSSCRGNVPNIFVEMLQRSLTDLKTSAITQNTVEEVNGLCNQILLSKMLYNYTLLDHIIYPFHTSAKQIIGNLKISSDIEINQHFTEIQKKEWFEPQIIIQKLNQLKKEILDRPKKPFDDKVNKISGYLVDKRDQIISNAVWGLTNKMFPHIFHNKITEFNDLIDRKSDARQQQGNSLSSDSCRLARQNLCAQITMLKANIRL